MLNRALLVAILLGMAPQYAISQENPFAATPTANPFATTQSQRYIGIFESDAIRLELAETETGIGGTLYYDATGQTYLVTAKLVEAALEGSFAVSGTDFTFTFVLEEDAKAGRFETEGYSGVLSAQGLAPLPKSRVEEIFEEAVELAGILPADQRGYVISSVVSLLAQTGDIDGARELIESLPAGDAYRSSALVGVAGGMIKTDGVEAARQVMNGVVEPNMRSSFDATYTLYLAEEGQLSEAYAFATGLPRTSGSLGVLTLFALKAHEAGDTEMANAALANARARITGASDMAERNMGFFQLASSHAQLGDVQAARRSLNEIAENDYLQVIGYAAVSEHFVRDGNRDAATQFAEDAFRKAKRIKPNGLRPAAVAAVAPAYAALRDTAKIQEVMNWVHQKNEYMSGVVLNNVILTQIRFRYLDAARSNAAQLTQTNLDSEILQAVAYDEAEAGDIDGALQTVRGMSSQPVRATSLATIAHILYSQSAEE